MSDAMISPEAIIDRRKLKRKLTVWRILALVLFAIAILGILIAAGAFDGFGKKSKDHIARVKISGIITNDKPMLELLGDLQENDRVKAVVIDMSSPGGSTVGGEAIYEAVRALSAKKPVVTTVGTLAASAGYMIAAASDYIVVRRSSIVGSIGVIFQYGQVAGLLDKLGVSVNEIKSAPLKAEPSPFHNTTDEAKAMIKLLIDDTYNWFVNIVAERRNFTPLKARQLADGSIFTGSQGLVNGLVDAIGNEDVALNWLSSEKGIDKDLNVINWKPDRDNDSLFSNPAGKSSLALALFFQKLGLISESQSINALQKILPQRLFLDGLISMLQIEGEVGNSQSRGQ